MLAALALTMASATAHAEQGFGPWGQVNAGFPPSVQGPDRTPGPVRAPGLLTLGVRLYQRTLSPVKGFSCPSWPSCSGFALRSIRRTGPVQGLLMTLDRLFIREHHDMGDFYPLVRLPDGVRYYDPPAHNDLVTELPPFRPFLSSLP